MIKLKVYYGKNAWWFIAFFILYNILPILIFLIDNSILSNILWIILWCVYYGFNIILIPIMVRNYIVLYDKYFVFYYGFANEKIEIKNILKIEKSNNFIASSANSLDRIHIVTKKKDFYIALKDNDNFINEIYHKKQYN